MQKEEKLKKINLFLSVKQLMFFLIIFLLFILRDGFGKNIDDAVFYIAYIIGFTIFTRKEVFTLFIFLLPLSNGPMLYFLNVIFGMTFIIKNAKYIKVTKVLLVCLLIVIWELLHLIQSSFLGFNDSLIKFFGFGLCIITTTLVISNTNLRDDYTQILRAWCLGFGSFCFILFTKYINNFGISNFTTIVRRFGWIPNSLETSSTMLSINPNTMGKLVILTIFCLITMMNLTDIFTIQTLIEIIYFLVFGLMTGSRTFLLVVFILFSIYSLELMFNAKENFKKILILSLVLLLITIIVNKYMQNTLVMISSRFEQSDLSGGRFETYKLYISSLNNYFLFLIFGSGMQNYNYKHGILNSSHNLFIEIISIWGIIGFILVFYWMLNLFEFSKMEKNKLSKNKYLYKFLPLLSLFLYSQTGQFFISYYHTLPTLVLAFLNIQYASKVNLCKDRI